MITTTVEWAVAALDEISQWWDELLADTLPGTRRRWYQRPDSEERKAERDELGRQERRDLEAGRFSVPSALRRSKELMPTGPMVAPAVVDALDVKLLTAVTLTQHYAAAHADRAGDGVPPLLQPHCACGCVPGDHGWAPGLGCRGCGPAVCREYRDEPGVPVARIARWLADVAPSLPAELLEPLARDARRLCRDLRQVTGRVEPVVTLDGTCPDCDTRGLQAFPLRETARCVHCRREWVGEAQLQWLSRIIGGPADPLPNEWRSA